MKLNMGCGQNKLADWVNVDSSPECGPDEVVDLEQTPWPWPDSSATEVLFNHSLEHMGGEPRVFLAMIQELYRVCAPGARIVINAPHPRSDSFIGDPTHVRIITPQVMQLFNRELNEQWRERKVANTPLGLYLGVDLAITRWQAVLAEPYRSQVQNGTLDQSGLQHAIRTYNNVVDQFSIEMTVRK